MNIKQLFAALVVLLFSTTAAAEPLYVCATTADLGSLVTAVGGDDVEVTTLTKGTEDPHFTEPKPSFVKALARADLYVENGLDLEIGWAPSLLRSARNASIQLGARGYLDASTAVEPLEVPAMVDRSMGDVHVFGNPHYLLDPVNGLLVARLIAARLAQLAPHARDRIEMRLADFEKRLGAALLGEELATRYDVTKLALLQAHGRLEAFLAEQGEEDRLGGWLATLADARGTKVVDDHNLWPYFARRFGLVVVEHLEPKPGISPTTAHLAKVIETIKAQQVRLLITAAYYNPRYARFVADKTGIRVAELAHQVGARPDADDYLATAALNVGEVARALGP